MTRPNEFVGSSEGLLCDSCDVPLGEEFQESTRYPGNCKECEYEIDCERAAEEREMMMGGDLIDGVGFADPGGNSALRAVTDDNPRDLPCPTCGTENVLTRIDRDRGYQCDRCADQAERGW